jgi:hypothetical protein
MIVSVFVRRLKPGATFQDFMREWEADEGFGVPTLRCMYELRTEHDFSHLPSRSTSGLPRACWRR